MRWCSEEETKLADKYLKKFSTSLAIKEMQIKSTLRFHLAPVKVAIFKKTNNNKFYTMDVGERNPHALLVGCKLV
jgi:hypothetical protein